MLSLSFTDFLAFWIADAPDRNASGYLKHASICATTSAFLFMFVISLKKRVPHFLFGQGNELVK